MRFRRYIYEEFIKEKFMIMYMGARKVLMNLLTV